MKRWRIPTGARHIDHVRASLARAVAGHYGCECWLDGTDYVMLGPAEHETSVRFLFVKLDQQMEVAWQNHRLMLIRKAHWDLRHGDRRHAFRRGYVQRIGERLSESLRVAKAVRATVDAAYRRLEPRLGLVDLTRNGHGKVDDATQQAGQMAADLADISLRGIKRAS